MCKLYPSTEFDKQGRCSVLKRFGYLLTRVISAVLAVTLMLVPVSALDPEMKVMIKGVHINEDPGAVMQDSVTYVPLRSFMDSLGVEYSITWNEERHRATVTAPNLYLTVKEGARYLTANDRCLYLYGTSFLYQDRLMVPIRPLAVACGLEVNWDEYSGEVQVEGEYSPILCADYFYDETELYWLSHIIYAEAGIEELEGMIGVGNVVLNRKARKAWPNTVYGVVFDERCGTQFTPAATGTIYQESSALAVVAAKIALEGVTVVEDSLYFVNASIADNGWFRRNCTYVTTLGRHTFYTSDTE